MTIPHLTFLLQAISDKILQPIIPAFTLQFSFLISLIICARRISQKDVREWENRFSELEEEHRRGFCSPLDSCTTDGSFTTRPQSEDRAVDHGPPRNTFLAVRGTKVLGSLFKRTFFFQEVAGRQSIWKKSVFAQGC